jgi:hypothetical protein
MSDRFAQSRWTAPCLPPALGDDALLRPDRSTRIAARRQTQAREQVSATLLAIAGHADGETSQRLEIAKVNTFLHRATTVQEGINRAPLLVVFIELISKRAMRWGFEPCSTEQSLNDLNIANW